MITLRKFLSLPREARLRKAVRLLRGWAASPENPEGLRNILTALSGLPPEAEKLLSSVVAGLSSPCGEQLAWNMNALMHVIMKHLGIPAADWDLRPPADASGEEAAAGNREGKTLPCRVYVDGIRSPFNLGSVFRSAECFGAREILIEPGSASPLHPRARRSAMGCIERVKWRFAEAGEPENSSGLFALELGGTPLEEFAFPEEGICVIGSEELGVRPRLLEAAGRSRGVVSIPLGGTKAALNVSVAFGILMYRWRAALLQ
ncbi:MAG: TrmH family RNA methyltransferase [Spirochaetaceae bacterium]|nr:TrmH family RNA methyltransferase [Spirochaetaceae bacterium]